ncbi:MAG TPA: hypothetical protein PKH07_04270, partial [bacterium]|nr:hypothetical protein [bacterium]
VDEQGALLEISVVVVFGVYKCSQIVTRYKDGTITAVNGHPSERLRTEAYGRSLDLPPNGYAGWTEDGKIDVRSSDLDGSRCDYAVTPSYIYVDGRGRFSRFEKAAGDGIGICRILGQNRYEIILYDGAECGFAIPAVKAVALDKEGKEICPAELRLARKLAYVLPVEGAFSYLVKGGRIRKDAEITSSKSWAVPGQRIRVTKATPLSLTPTSESNPLLDEIQVPNDAKDGQRLWFRRDGSWIDFTCMPSAEVDIAIEETDLVVALKSNHEDERAVTISAMDRSQKMLASPQRTVQTRFPMETFSEETLEPLIVDVKGDGFDQRVEAILLLERKFIPLLTLPIAWEKGMCLRGGQETGDFGTTQANVSFGQTACGGETKVGFAMHPPWVGGVGYVFALYSPITFPCDHPAAFRAFVGKGDGSNAGDGILYRLGVVDESGHETIVAEQTVTKHEWLPLEADMSPWMGKKVSLKLMADVGLNDDSSGDWACWADMRLESLDQTLAMTLERDTDRFRMESGPYPLDHPDLKVLRTARSGRLHYEGQGLQGPGIYEINGHLNGIELGLLAPASGDE